MNRNESLFNNNTSVREKCLFDTSILEGCLDFVKYNVYNIKINIYLIIETKYCECVISDLFLTYSYGDFNMG